MSNLRPDGVILLAFRTVNVEGPSSILGRACFNDGNEATEFAPTRGNNLV